MALRAGGLTTWRATTQSVGLTKEVDMHDNLGKEMLPFKMQQLLDILIEKKKLGVEDALHYLYSSDLYNQLSSEASSLWQYSSLSLYELLKKEKQAKRKKRKINSALLLFYVFCLENYKEYKQLCTEEALSIFYKYNVIEFLEEVYETLHTQGKGYIMEELELYITNREE